MYEFDKAIFSENADYFESIGRDIWLMDDHKWAFVVWNENRKRNEGYLLVHVDYHWDSVYDYWDSPEEEKIFLASGDDEVMQIVKEGSYIRFDSFICPAVAKGFVDEIHFYCLQGDEQGDIAIDLDLLEKYNCSQVLHDSSQSLSAIETSKPIIFDFCIDVFNRSSDWYGSEIWPDDEIEELLMNCKPLVQRAEIVTVSMSYGYSGAEADTERLTRHVIECFLDWRK